MITGIGEKTFEAIQAQVKDLLEGHTNSIKSAFLKTENKKLKVDIKILFEQKGDGVTAKTSIAYLPSEKVKDENTAFIKENQMAIFPKTDE